MTAARHAIRSAALAALLLLMAGPARAETPAAAPPAEPLVLAAPASLDAAAKAIEQATGAKAGRVHTRTASVPAAEGRSFEIDHRTAGRLLAGSHAVYRKAGFYLFRYERGFGLADDKDSIGLLATADWRAVVRRMGTAGASRGITGERIVVWLDEVGKENPFELTEVGVDYVAGRFEREPKDPTALARKVVEIAPDMVRGHKDPIAGLADLVGRERTLYLFWD